MAKQGRGALAVKVLRSLIHAYEHRIAHQHFSDRQPQVAIYAFDSIGQAINLFGRLEREELEVLIGWLAAQGRVQGGCIDVGANIGNHALFFAGHYARVFAFEPVPRTFRLLEINASLADNVRCFNLGLSNNAADVWIIDPTSNSGAAKILSEQQAAGRAATRTKVIPLDSINDLAHKKIGLIKIDVEGHELQVLQGAVGLIARNRPVILIEQRQRDFQDGTTPCLDFLKTQGYSRFATIRKSPTFGNSYLTVLARFVWGERIEMVDIEKFEAKYYPMIAALP